MANPSMGAKLQSMPKPVLFLLLILCTAVPLFFHMRVPNAPVDSSIDLYAKLMEIPAGSTVLISSDWTNSTRGESGGQFESLVRILMRKGVKFAVYTAADPQAPQVSRDSIARLNEERRAKGQKPYEIWNDWLSLGYYPNAEAQGQAIANDIRAAFGTRKVVPPGEKTPRNVFESPVFKNIQDVGDLKMVIVNTASKTSTITIERLYGKVPLALLVTGVMGPESQNYYTTGQVVGLVTGLKGLLDMETLMSHGVNTDDPQTVKSDKYQKIDGFPGEINEGKGTAYYPALHFALALMIVVVVIGNVGMFMSRKEAQK